MKRKRTYIKIKKISFLKIILAFLNKMYKARASLTYVYSSLSDMV